MDHYFDYILNETRYEPDPDDGATFAEPDSPTQDEVDAYWSDGAREARGRQIPF